MKSGSAFSIDPVRGFKIEAIGEEQPELRPDVRSAQKYTVALSNSNLPILAEWPYSNVREILDTKRLTECPTCVDISPDGLICVLGYESGNIVVIDLEKENILKYHKRKDKPGIVHLAFGDNSEVFVAADSEGGLYHFTCKVVLGLAALKERQIHTPLPRHFIQGYCPTPDSTWMIGATEDSVLFIRFVDDNTSATQEVYKSQELEVPKFITNHHKGQLMIAINTGTILTVFSFTDTGKWTLLSESDIPDHIENVFYLGNRVYVLVLENHTLQILKASGQFADICSSDELESTLQNAKCMFTNHQKLFIMNEGSLFQLSFLDWGNVLQQLKEEQNWAELFEIARGIYTGNNLEYFGLPSSVKKRCTALQTIMESIFKDAIKNPENPKEVLEAIMDTCGIIEMPEFFTTSLMNFAKSKNLLTDYFTRSLAEGTEVLVLERYITEAQLDVLFTLPPMVVSSILLKSNIIPKFPSKISAYAQKTNNDDLLLKIWIDVYGDYLSPCLYYANNLTKLHMYLHRVFLGDLKPNYAQKVVVALYFFSPVNGKFPRLNDLILKDKEKSPMIIKHFFKLAPIKMLNGNTLDYVKMVDAVLHVVIEYTQTMKRENVRNVSPQIYDIIARCMKVVLKRNLKIPMYAIKFIMFWIFNDDKNTDVREHTLQLINCLHPDIVKLKDLIQECEAAGFSEIIIEYYMADKNYDLIIKILLSIKDRRKRIFPFIEEHINETDKIQLAIEENIQVLILIDAAKTAKIIGEMWPDYHRPLMRKDIGGYAKYLYLKEMSKNPVCAPLVTEDDTMEYFMLICQYCPEEALPMLKTTSCIMFDKALPICERNRVVDACVHIHTMLGDNQSAVQMVSEELQQELVEILHNKKKPRVLSLDRVGDDKYLKVPYHTILLAFELLAKTPSLGMKLDEMWRDIFRAFQLPMYLTARIMDQETKSSYNLFFAYFIVELIQRTSGDFVMATLHRDFSIIPEMQMRSILLSVFKHFDYQKMLSSAVTALLLQDCKTLRVDATLVRSRAANIWTTRCGICNQFITGQGGVGMLIFQCGHCFHNNSVCGKHTSCPVCKGIAARNNNAEMTLSKRTMANRARALQRVEFGLKRNFGEEQDDSASGHHIYFLPEYPVKATEKLKPKLAEILPTPNSVFSEI